MLTPEENQLMTQVGPGTPCGDYMRRFWQPIALSSEVRDFPRKVRVLGEDLVLFRDGKGKLGLLGIQCSHRLASLEFGHIEENGIRCMYHGWLYDNAGRCLDQPAEPSSSTFKDRIKHPAYPVRELGGLVFAYMGRGDPPPLPLFDALVKEDGVRSVCRLNTWPCNYLQIVENAALDAWHTVFAHGYGGTVPRYYSMSMKAWYRETDLGVSMLQVRKGPKDGTIYIRESATILPSVTKHTLRPFRELKQDEIAIPGVESYYFRTPIDDANTVTFRADFLPAKEGDRQKWVKYIDEVANRESWATSWPPPADKEGRYLLGKLPDQDAAVTVSQGPIARREREHLATSDRGVIMFRRVLKERIEAVQSGKEPQGSIRSKHIINVRTADEFIDVGTAEDIEKVMERLGTSWVSSGIYKY